MNDFIMDDDIEIEDDNDDVITDPEVYYNRAFVLYDTNHYQDALSEIDKAIKYGDSGIKYIKMKLKILYEGFGYESYYRYVKKISCFSLSQYSLKRIIDQTLFSAGKGNNPLFNTVLFEISENRLMVTTLDGHRIAHCTTIINNNSSNSNAAIIPINSLEKLYYRLTNTNDIYVNFLINNNEALFMIDENIVDFKLLSGSYFDYREFLSSFSNHKTKVQVIRNELLEILELACATIKAKTPCIISVCENRLHFSAESNTGMISRTLSVVKRGDDIRMGFNPKFLVEPIRVIDDETIQMYFSPYEGPCVPCHIRDDNGNYHYLILPININR